MIIRFAAEADAAALLAIYGQYIAASVTFETELPSREEFAGRIRDISGTYPYLIAEEDGRAVGYAYAHRAKERAAYGWMAELSIYLDRDHTGKGLGRKLYAMVLDMLRLQNVKTAMGCVTLPNPGSEALHAGAGFHLVGVSKKAGYKGGAWHDVAWFEMALGPYDVPPDPVIPIGALDPAALAAIIKKYR